MFRADVSPLPEPEFSLFCRRNSSLSPRGRRLAFGVLAAVSMGVAVAWALAGAWMVVPYSLVEIGALFLAFRVLERSADDWERVIVAGDRVVVEASRRGTPVRYEFNRFWVQIAVREEGQGGASAALQFAGRTVPIGEFLPGAERRRMADQLRAVLRSRR